MSLPSKQPQPPIEPTREGSARPKREVRTRLHIDTLLLLDKEVVRRTANDQIANRSMIIDEAVSNYLKERE